MSKARVFHTVEIQIACPSKCFDVLPREVYLKKVYHSKVISDVSIILTRDLWNTGKIMRIGIKQIAKGKAQSYDENSLWLSSKGSFLYHK